MKPRNDETKQVTLEDISGFAKVIEAIRVSKGIESTSLDSLENALNSIADDVEAADRVTPDNFMHWLPELLGVTKAERVTTGDVNSFGKVLDAIYATGSLDEHQRMQLAEAIDMVSEIAGATDTTDTRFLKVWMPAFLGIGSTTRTKAASKTTEDDKPSDTGGFFSGTDHDEIARAIDRLDQIMQGDSKSVEQLLLLVDHLDDETTGAAGDLEHLRYALFLETPTFHAAYDLFKHRYDLIDSKTPEGLIKEAFDKYVLLDKQGGDANG